MTRDPARYADGQNMQWDLVAFSTQDESLCGEFPISRERFVQVRELFEYGDDEWFANSFPVGPELWPQVIEILACPPPEPDRVYFIEGTATDY